MEKALGPEQLVLYAYLVLFSIYFLVELTLDCLNLRNVRTNAVAVPPMFSDFIDPATYSKSVNYTLTKGRFGIISFIYSSICLLLFVVMGWFGQIDAWLSKFGFATYTHGVLYVFLVSFLFSALSLPFSLYSTFVIEEKFGFNKTTFKLWLVDLAKALVLSLLLLTPLLYAIFWFMDKAGAYWWVYCVGLVLGFQFLMLFLFPTFVLPLFNKLTPLPEGTLRDAINALAEKIDFKTSGIFVMDGSKRSGKSNAFFTGIGSAKRIVLFDTLVNSISQDELVSVLAHEIGHQKLHHIRKTMIFGIISITFSFWVLSKLIAWQPLFLAFGFPAPSYHAALIIFQLASSPISYFISPLFSMLSRKHEYEADRFAAQNVGTGQHLMSSLKKLSRDNLSNLTPHPWYSFFHYGHPTLGERLAALQRYALTM